MFPQTGTFPTDLSQVFINKFQLKVLLSSECCQRTLHDININQSSRMCVLMELRLFIYCCPRYTAGKKKTCSDFFASASEVSRVRSLNQANYPAAEQKSKTSFEWLILGWCSTDMAMLGIFCKSSIWLNKIRMVFHLRSTSCSVKQRKVERIDLFMLQKESSVHTYTLCVGLVDNMPY